MDASVMDASPHRDASIDRVVVDALPPIDVVKQDVIVLSDCPDASDTRIYLFTEQNELFSFFPPSLQAKKIGNIACPGTNGTPDSMGVDRKGVAYGVLTSGELVKMSTATAACIKTPYAPSQMGWTVFGMAFNSISDGGEALFVTDHTGPMSRGLATIDTNLFKLDFINTFNSPLTRCELTGTGDGRLFAFCINQNQSGSVVAQIDPTNANVIGADNLKVGNPMNGYAFAFWGGVFWIFTSTQSSTDVTRYDPMTKIETLVKTINGSTVVGAGVSTCAPQ